MKWIGQHVYDLISRFRNDVYLEDISDHGSDPDRFLTMDSTTGKVTYRTGAEVFSDIGAASGDITAVAVGSDALGLTYTSGEASFTIAGGNAITTSGGSDTITIDHDDTSSQASVNNSSLTYIQDVTLDTYGHVTGLTSTKIASKHVLRCNAFYLNDNPMVQNSLYFGNSVGNTPWNFNDPAAVGGVIGDTSSFTIIGDDENWGIVLPMDISKIEVQCSLRPGLGGGDDFTIAIYTGVRSTDSAAALTLTKIGHESVSFSTTSNNYTRNDIDVSADLNKGAMIYVGVGSEDSTSAKNARGYMNITVTER